MSISASVSEIFQIQGGDCFGGSETNIAFPLSPCVEIRWSQARRSSAPFPPPHNPSKVAASAGSTLDAPGT